MNIQAEVLKKGQKHC